MEYNHSCIKKGNKMHVYLAGVITKDRFIRNKRWKNEVVKERVIIKIFSEI